MRLVVLVLLLLQSAHLEAVTLTEPKQIEIRFTGTLEETEYLGSLAPFIGSSTKVLGSIRYLVSDSLEYGFSTGELDPGSDYIVSDWSFGLNTEPTLSYQLFIGELAITYSFGPAGSTLAMETDPLGRQYLYFETSRFAPGGDIGVPYDYYDFYFALENTDSGSDLFTEDQAISATPPMEIGEFTSGSGGFVVTDFGAGGNGDFTFTVDSLSVVPEPTGLSLCLSAALLAGCATRRRP